jgi:hypothetical protein
MEPVRILHLAPTTERKAERGRFENALRSAGAAVAGGVSSSLGLAAPFVPGGPVLAAAVKGAIAPPPGASPGAAASGGDVVEATRALQVEAQSFNLQYLQLQESLQRESREFTAVSNVMKVRHDTAKSAIQNIH